VSSIEELLHEHLDSGRQWLEDRDVDVRAPLPKACTTCPWRAENQANPPTGPTATRAEFYTPEGIARHWANYDDTGLGLRDGFAQICHLWPDEAVHWCAGTSGIHHRCVLRWAFDRSTCDPLSGYEAVTAILANMLRVAPDRIVVFGENHATGTWKLVPDGLDSAAAEAAGLTEPITLEKLVAIAHPSAADPDVACEFVPPPTAEEIAAWTGLGRGHLSCRDDPTSSKLRHALPEAV
jgi:hypothetical protein